jgi:protein phosphatase-4 regulatory subunit 3
VRSSLIRQVYELREQSWYDRGTGFCKGVYDDIRDLALLVVVPEDIPGPGEEESTGPGGFLKEDLLLNSRVEHEDIYHRQQGASGLKSREGEDRVNLY